MPMDKENGEGDKGGPPDASAMLDAASLFAYWPRGDAGGGSQAASGLFGGIPGGFGNHLASPGYMMGGRGGGAGAYGLPTPTTGSYGTLSVAASQAASLGINPASAAWWTMASHLAAQDYLARLQQSAAASGISFADGMVPGYPMMSVPHTSHSHHGSSGGKSAGSKSKANTTTTMSMSLPLLAGGLPTSREREREHREHKREREREHREAREAIVSTSNSVHHPPSIVSDPSSILGGVRLPPDTEIIKYTSSIVGPKIPGTTNRGRKKTISLDPPSVSVLPSLSSTGLPIERNKGGRRPRDSLLARHNMLRPGSAATDYSRGGDSNCASDRVEVIKLPAHNSNGTASLNIPSFSSPSFSSSGAGSGGGDAPLNLSLKPGGSTPSTPLQALALTVASPHERISRRKGGGSGARPRRVVQPGVSAIPASPSPSLAQLFAAADSPRPSSGSEENDSQHKDGRPRNLGRGVSKPKKNTVASLLAQSRALGIKPLKGLELSPLNHQVSLLKSNILAAQQQMGVKDLNDQDLSTNDDYDDKPRGGGKGKSGGGGGLSDSSAADVSSDSCSDETDSDSEAGSKRDGDESDRSTVLPTPAQLTQTLCMKLEVLEEVVPVRPPAKRRVRRRKGPSAKRRKTEAPDERELRIPLEHGWRRETVISGVSRVGALRGEVMYYSPCGRRFKQISDVVRYLDKHNISDMARDNFSFSAKVLMGDFLQPTGGEEMMRLTDEQVLKRLDELRLERGSGTHRVESSRHAQDQKLAQQVEREKLAHARRLAKEESARQKEHSRLVKEQERCERQEALRREREQRNQQMMEARRRRQHDLEKQREEEHLRKQQERERRRQHMTLVKALESRKRQEERERKRQELRAEKQASKERKIEQRRVELELVRELRKPAEDMELTDQNPLPTLNRIPGLKLSGQAFADTLMVFEFLHNFGETLGFDMESLPSLNSLQMALLNDEEAEEELLSVMTHLLVCAIEDPGIPNPARHTTILGQSLKQADITHTNLSEILRIYLYANATGEVKALTGLSFERDREKKSDHHNSWGGDSTAAGAGAATMTCGKNAAFFEHLHLNATWGMSERLNDRPFLALNPTHKAAILAFLCNELLQNKAVLRQIEGSIEAASQMRKDRWLHDTRMRKLRMLHGRRVRQIATAVMIAKQEASGGVVSVGVGTSGGGACDESLEGAEVKKQEQQEVDEEEGEEEAEEGAMSEAESDTGTQPEEEEDKNLSPEELARKLDKVTKQYESSISALSQSAQQLRATCLGQDRFWRRYWALPCAGAVFVEAMESASPDVYSDGEEGGEEKQQAAMEVEEEKEKAAEKGSEEKEPVGGEEEKQLSEEGEEVKRTAVEGEEEKQPIEGCEGGDNLTKDVTMGDAADNEDSKNEHRKIRTRDTTDNERTVAETNSITEGELNASDGDSATKECKSEPEASIKSEVMDVCVDGKEKAEPMEVDASKEIKREGEIEESDVEKNDNDIKSNVEARSDNGMMSAEADVKSESDVKSDSEVKSDGEVKSEKVCVDATPVKSEDVDIKVENGLSSENELKSDDDVKSERVDSLSAVKVEIKSDLFGAELKSESAAEEKDEKPKLATAQYEPLGGESGDSPVIVPNGDKFNALNHLYSLNTSVFNNGKDLNGSFMLGAAATTERNWFSVLPRDACDSASVINGNASTRFIGSCGSELRIPVFPPPCSRMSPSPGGSQCDSPGPLVLTPEEAAQLEYMKKTGGFMEPLPPKPVPRELRRGWWRITDQDQLHTILNHLHSRGFRESQLKRILTRYTDHTLESCGKLCIVSGDKAATELAITDMDHKVSALPGGAPLVDPDSAWDSEVALRVDMFMLDQVEVLEDKVANASMQVKGWKVPIRATTDDGPGFRPACLPDADLTLRNPVEIAKDRLLSLEAAIERRYLKPPLGISTGDVNLQGMSGEALLDDALPKGLVTWRDAVSRSHTSAQLAMALYMLEASVAWDKSIMKAVSHVKPRPKQKVASGKGFSNCQFCHSGENEDKLLLCDGCDKGYHMYCFKPKMENIPDGDWYCYECMNKATGERNCIVCGKKALGKNLVLCDMCPRAYHCDCLQVALTKVPRGKWYCPTCQAKQPRKRGTTRRSKPSESSGDQTPGSPTVVNTPPASATPTSASAGANEDSTPAAQGSVKAASPPPPPTPVTPVRKERATAAVNKKVAKELKPCIALMEELEAHDEAWPFLLPVNTKQFPTYRKIIKSPMDLSTIKKKLTDTTYKGRDEFCVDVRQIFNNCETFNEDDSPVGKAGHSMRLFFEARWTEIAGSSHNKATSTP